MLSQLLFSLIAQVRNAATKKQRPSLPPLFTHLSSPTTFKFPSVFCRFFFVPYLFFAHTSFTSASVTSPTIRSGPFLSSTSFVPPFKSRSGHELSGSVFASLPSSQSAFCMSILESPSAERNKGPIWDVLSSSVLPALSIGENTPLRVLEVAAGCGVHTQHFVSKLINDGYGQRMKWHPTDPNAQCRDSIDSRINTIQDNVNTICLKQCVNQASSLTLDAEGITERQCESTSDFIRRKAFGDMNLIVCINMIHISPWEATVGLMKTARWSLKKGGILYCYGPYKISGTAVPSNISFDQSLRSRDPSWGVRDLEAVVREADANGLKLLQAIEMPANNLSVISQKM